MRKFYRDKTLKFENEILKLDNIKTVKISSVVFDNEKAFKIIVNKFDHVKIGSLIMINEDGQKIFSPISGEVVFNGTFNDIFCSTVQDIEIENDYKNITESIQTFNVKNKQELIDLCKNFGLINNKFFLYKYFENLKENSTLYINPVLNYFQFINCNFLDGFKEDIEFTINFLDKIFNFKKIKLISKTKLNLNVNKCSYTNKKIKMALSFADLLDIFAALNGEVKTHNYISIYGGAIKKNYLIKAPIGASIEDLLNMCGGFKQDIEEIENFKYTAMLAYNDELELKKKIKLTKNQIDKERLNNLLKEKMLQAKENVFSKLEDFRIKFLNCLSCINVNNIKDKKFIKNYENFLNNSVYAVSFLNNKEFH